MSTIIFCSDGSDLSIDALRAGIELLQPASSALVVTVAPRPDESVVIGSSGLAGGTMTADEYETMVRTQQDEAERIVAETRDALGLADAEVRVLAGEPAKAICELAEELGADAIVIGSRGLGRIKRALLGSVSDQVVRNAPCVVVVGRDQSD